MKVEKEKLSFREIWDKPSKKGYPTKDSIVITIAIYSDELYEGGNTAGFAIKVPGDQHIPKIGRAIARREQYSKLFDVDKINPEKHTINFLQLIGKRFSSDIMNRIKIMTGIHSFGYKDSEYFYPLSKRYLNKIED